tara:strand:- start:223 stop:396 length:174 start_codon:yes stop_codon:yes gene_type:complete
MLSGYKSFIGVGLGVVGAGLYICGLTAHAEILWIISGGFVSTGIAHKLDKIKQALRG